MIGVDFDCFDGAFKVCVRTKTIYLVYRDQTGSVHHVSLSDRLAFARFFCVFAVPEVRGDKVDPDAKFDMYADHTRRSTDKA